MSRGVIALLVTVALVVATGVGYLVGETSAPTSADAADATKLAYQESFNTAEATAFTTAKQKALPVGKKKGKTAGSSDGSDAIAAQEAAQAAAEQRAAEARAAEALAAIPERCRGIPMNTTAYTMCIYAPDF
jgi:hypothetical protein